MGLRSAWVEIVVGRGRREPSTRPEHEFEGGFEDELEGEFEEVFEEEETIDGSNEWGARG